MQSTVTDAVTKQTKNAFSESFDDQEVVLAFSALKSSSTRDRDGIQMSVIEHAIHISDL